jgi:hypothetical protein
MGISLETPPLSWPQGHERVAHRLEGLLQSQELPHALLFVGISGIGKRLFARTFAKKLLDPEGRGGVADLFEMAPEGKVGNYSIAALDELRHQIQLTALSGSWKVFLIDDADRMTPTAANSLLKLLEEPPERTLILLISGNPQTLLPTLISRCQVLFFEPLAESLLVELLQKKGHSQETSELLARRSFGSMERAERLAGYQQDRTLRQIQEWLPQLHTLQASRITVRLTEADGERGKQETDLQETRALFQERTQLILDWARDLHLVRYGTSQGLCFPEYSEVMREQIQKGVASLTTIEQAVSDSRRAAERMAKPSVLLSGLLLRLRTRENPVFRPL